MVRAPGFPAHRVLELASPSLASAADGVLALEAEATHKRDAVIAECRQVSAQERPHARRALRLLARGRVPEPLEAPAAEAARQVLAEVCERHTRAVGELTHLYTASRRQVSEAVRRLANDTRFREALLWQNPGALHTGVDSLLKRPPEATDRSTREKERLVASYVQRYCVKNDSIGFFGPIGWGDWVDSRTHLAQRPGPALVANRSVYFEHWAIDALATTLSRESALRPFMAPRRLPRFRLQGQTLCYPVGRRTELTPELAAVFALCDGTRLAQELARELAPADEGAVYSALEELAGAGAIQWAFEVPTAGVHPDLHLAVALARVAPADLRERAEGALDGLRRGRAAVAASQGPSELDSALRALDATFTGLTGAAGHRLHGKTYAGRTLVYEDCRRDHQLQLGTPLLERLGPPLALLLTSARWFTHEVSERYRTQLTALFHRLRLPGGEPLEFAHFWQEASALFPGPDAPGSIVASVRQELQRRWAEVLQLPPSAAAVVRSATQLSPEVQRQFAAPGPGWPLARHHSPDVLIAAAGEQAVQRGDYQLVLGELHSGLNTLVSPVLAKQHPQPEELIRALEADVGQVCVAPVWSKAVSRGDYYSLSDRDLDLELGEVRSARPRNQALQVGALVVEEREGQLEVRSRDGLRRFDLIAFLERHLIAESHSAFSPMARAPFTPRVTVDAVVIARATWRFEPQALPWPALEEGAARFVAARAWARSLGVPRWAFIKTPEEVKPVYVDFDSPLYVELLAKQLRAASAATLSEMLPALNDTWLLDAEGARYTAELRLAAVDPKPWRPPQVPAGSR